MEADAELRYLRVDRGRGGVAVLRARVAVRAALGTAGLERVVGVGCPVDTRDSDVPDLPLVYHAEELQRGVDPERTVPCGARDHRIYERAADSLRGSAVADASSDSDAGRWWRAATGYEIRAPDLRARLALPVYRDLFAAGVVRAGKGRARVSAG